MYLGRFDPNEYPTDVDKDEFASKLASVKAGNANRPTLSICAQSVTVPESFIIESISMCRRDPISYIRAPYEADST